MESESVPSHEKLPKFREVLKQNDLDGYFIPCNDAHNVIYYF